MEWVIGKIASSRWLRSEYVFTFVLVYTIQVISRTGDCDILLKQAFLPSNVWLGTVKEYIEGQREWSKWRVEAWTLSTWQHIKMKILRQKVQLHWAFYLLRLFHFFSYISYVVFFPLFSVYVDFYLL